MKDRIKIDSALLSLLFIFTVVLFQFPHFFPHNVLLDDVLDFLGFGIALTGTFLRMSGRGHKKAHSAQGHGLVVTGPYTLVRNPMYLGSFLMGAGFILIVWPWFMIPVFAVLFYQRFNIQMLKEEEHLKIFFGQTYENYARGVPRIFPRLKNLPEIEFRRIFPREELWTTKETRALFFWPLLAVVMESIQEKIVFGYVNFPKIIFNFTLSAAIFVGATAILYKKNR